MRVTTAGESHGKGLFALIEGLPAGLAINLSRIDSELLRRQSGYGRGARQKLERDRVEIFSGVRDLVTTGSPVTLFVRNRDYENWKDALSPEGCDGTARPLTRLRPGHADLPGIKKFGGTDARNVSERASARETAVRVAAGTICRLLLEKLGIEVSGRVLSVGGIRQDGADAETLTRALIDEARERGDTLGGVLELRVKNLKSGFGSCMTYREKLDARLTFALMSVQGIKGVEIGDGFLLADLFGSAAHDEICMREGAYVRTSNHAGGIEGGMSNGEEILLRAAMKPLPTLARGLSTVDAQTGEQTISAAERGDVCAVEACCAVLEAALCTELCSVVLERLGGDRMEEVLERYRGLTR